MGHTHGLGSVYSGQLIKYSSDKEPRCAHVSPQDGEEQDVQGLRTKGNARDVCTSVPPPNLCHLLEPALL